MLKLTTLLAIWGAALSTILALVKLIPEWPVLSVWPSSTPGADLATTIEVRVFNPAKRPLFIEGSFQLPLRASKFRIIDNRPLELREHITRAFEDQMGYTRKGQPRLYVAAEDWAILSVSGIEAGTSRTIVFWWHRNWLLRWVRFPAIVRVSSDLAEMLNRGR